jgi:hypothetical protein
MVWDVRVLMERNQPPQNSGYTTDGHLQSIDRFGSSRRLINLHAEGIAK